MRIFIPPVNVDGVTCTQGDASVAVSSNAAVRVVPVDADGVRHPAGVITIVGGADVAELIRTVAEEVQVLLEGRVG